ncbi:MAG: type II toxin-antitoxin system RelE/ParE family toxin [Vicinamibacteria bacterium]|nr:type II toxin-antitoxin system RelE/ParE family toxin [Vicinamibacteria bacterium]
MASDLVARYRDAIYVLHAFEKKSRKTPKKDLALARDRCRLLTGAEGRYSAIALLSDARGAEALCAGTPGAGG